MVLRHCREHFMHKFSKERIALLVCRIKVMDLAIRVNDKDPSQIDAYSTVRDSICVPVAKAAIVGVPLIGE